MITFTSRAQPAPAAAPVLARATQIIGPSPRGGFCEPMTLTIGGRGQTPLLGGATVVRAAQRLLGTQIPPTPRG